MSAAAPAAADAAALAARVAELEALLEEERAQRNAERAARIRLQRAARATRLGGGDGVAASADGDEAPALAARAIGTLHSCFSRRNGTPRQPALVPAARAVLQLRRGIPGDALSGLDGFSHAWVVYVFHANTNLHVPDARFKARVAVPRLDGGTRGVFATRTPHRPVPLGLSLGRLLAVDAQRGTVHFQGLDLVDGTPVLDIKPYVPFCDAPPAGEALAPDWVAPVASGDAAVEPLRVTAVSVTPAAAAELAAAYGEAESARRAAWHAAQRGAQHAPHPPALYPTPAEFQQLVTQVLSLDIRSLRQRTGAARALPVYHVILCCVEVDYTINEQRRVDVTGARRALPEEAWEAAQDAAAALSAVALSDGEADGDGNVAGVTEMTAAQV